MPAPGVLLLITVVLIVLALVYFLVSTIMALKQIADGLDDTITAVGEIIAKTEPIAPVRAADVDRWDDTADVVVVGLGVAGTCAAIEAAEAGAEVLALERSMTGGGTSAHSGGIIYLGGGTPIQEACGFEDTAADMFAFLVAACGPVGCGR